MARIVIVAVLFSGAVSAGSQSPTAPPPSQSSPASQIEGVKNYTKVDASIGCAGATDPKAMTALAAAGYRAVLSLREAAEEGALIEESRAAAEAAGMKYIHLPFKGSAPDPKVADEFLKVVADSATQPLFIHCATANRVGAMWLIKRMVADKWTDENALAEAKSIGLTSAALQKFAFDYVAAHKN